jgi:hypothetical protein
LSPWRTAGTNIVKQSVPLEPRPTFNFDHFIASHFRCHSPLLCQPTFVSITALRLTKAHNTFVYSSNEQSFLHHHEPNDVPCISSPCICLCCQRSRKLCSHRFPHPTTNTLPGPHKLDPRTWPALHSLFLTMRPRRILLCSQFYGNPYLRLLPRNLHINFSMRNQHLRQRFLCWPRPALPWRHLHAFFGAAVCVWSGLLCRKQHADYPLWELPVHLQLGRAVCFQPLRWRVLRRRTSFIGFKLGFLDLLHLQILILKLLSHQFHHYENIPPICNRYWLWHWKSDSDRKCDLCQWDSDSRDLERDQYCSCGTEDECGGWWRDDL